MEEEKYYCPNCEWEVTFGDPKCYNCKQELSWEGTKTNAIKKKIKSKKEKIAEYEEENELERFKEYREKHIVTEDEDIENTYDFFLRAAHFYSVFYYIIAVIVFIGGIIFAFNVGEDIGIGIFFITLIVCLVLIGIGIIYEKNLKYKAYVLKNLHRINLNTKQKK